jgi:hypothetical protein
MGLIGAVDAAGLAAEVLGDADSEAGALCWVAGLSGWVAVGDCCAKSGKLAMATSVVTNEVPVFMNPPLVSRFRTRHVGDAVTSFEMFCKRSAKPRHPRRLTSGACTLNRSAFSRQDLRSPKSPCRPNYLLKSSNSFQARIPEDLSS